MHTGGTEPSSHAGNHRPDDLQERMERREVKIGPALHCFSAIRNIERIADHAVNIAEEVIYLVDAEIVRHSRAPSTPKSS